MKPKSIKIIYWAATGILALFILPGIFFLNSPMAQEGTKHLGFPHWFSMEVGICSFIGGLILVIPGLPPRLKEWNYVALGIIYLSALIAHLSVDGLVGASFMPLVPFALLLISYVYYHKLYTSSDPSGLKNSF